MLNIGYGDKNKRTHILLKIAIFLGSHAVSPKLSWDPKG